jgi:heat shock protein HslJ
MKNQKIYNRLALLIGLAFLIGTTACQVEDVVPGTGPDGQPPLFGTSWVLSELRGEEPLQGAEPTLAFDTENVVGQTGCNSFGGAYEARADGFIFFSDLVQTEIYCMEPEGVMEQEADYISALNQAAFFNIVDDRLELQDQAGENILVFVSE